MTNAVRPGNRDAAIRSLRRSWQYLPSRDLREMRAAATCADVTRGQARDFRCHPEHWDGLLETFGQRVLTATAITVLDDLLLLRLRDGERRPPRKGVHAQRGVRL